MLRPFAHPAACCCAKFETSKTCSDLQTELLANNVASVCTRLNSSFWEIRITSYSKRKNDILDHLYRRWTPSLFISLFYVSKYMKWLIFFIYFHSCHFYHRVYYELTMACSPDGYVRVSLNFFRFLFNRSGCLFNCEDHFHFYSLFYGNKEKSYLRLSLKSFQWLFSTFIFKKNIPLLFTPRFNKL